MPRPWYVIVGNSFASKNGGAAKVLVARDVLRADAADIDRNVDTASGQVLRHRDGSCDQLSNLPTHASQ
jgi:hypothetical protein